MEIVFKGWADDFWDVHFSSCCEPVGSNCPDYSCRGNWDN